MKGDIAPAVAQALLHLFDDQQLGIRLNFDVDVKKVAVNIKKNLDVAVIQTILLQPHLHNSRCST